MLNLKIADFFVLRQPILPKTVFRELDSNNVIEIMKDPFVVQAIAFASPAFIESWNKRGGADPKLVEKAYQYIIRMASRTVPFGAFTSISVGAVGRYDELFRPELKSVLFNLDENAYEIDGFYRKLLTDKNTLTNSKYFLNPSLSYLDDNTIRLYSWSWNGNERSYSEDHLRLPSPLFQILKSIHADIDYNELSKVFSIYRVEKGEHFELLNELVVHKILIPNFHPSGEGNRTNLNNWSENLPESKIKNEILIYKNKIKDLSAGTFIEYKKINANIVAYDNVQQTLSRKTVDEIGNIADKLIKAFSNRSRVTYKTLSLDIFRHEFQLKYDAKHVPLLDVLGQLDLKPDFDKHLISDSKFSLEKFWFSKFANNPIPESGRGWQLELNKSDWSELENIDQNYLKIKCENPSSGTIYFHRINNITVLNSVYGAGPSKTLARFAHESNVLEHKIRDFNNEEQLHYKDVEFADIDNFDSGNTTNTSRHNSSSKYKIKIFTGYKDNADVISLNDLYIFSTGNRLVLYSRKLKKEIVPNLNSAIWPSTDAISSTLYKFLILLKSQNEWPSVRMMFGDLEDLGHKPRILSDGVICRPESWTFDAKKLLPYLNEKRISELKLPKIVHFIQGDRKTPIFFESNISISAFQKEVMKLNLKNELVYLEESIFDYQNEQVQINEIALPFLNQNFKRKSIRLGTKLSSDFNKENDFECLYFQFYCSHKNDYFLNSILAPFLEKMKIERFFYIRFNSPSYHIRLRILCSKNEANEIRNQIITAATKWSQSNYITQISNCVYEPEAAVYGGEIGVRLFERLSIIDSRLALQFLKFSPFSGAIDSALTHRQFAFLVTLGIYYAKMLWSDSREAAQEIQTIAQSLRELHSNTIQTSMFSTYQKYRRIFLKNLTKKKLETNPFYQFVETAHRSAIKKLIIELKSNNLDLENIRIYERLIHLMYNRIVIQNEPHHEYHLFMSIVGYLRREAALIERNKNS